MTESNAVKAIVFISGGKSLLFFTRLEWKRIITEKAIERPAVC